ncbi:hypothetical protein AUC68_09265 [Methyloceanibacter methanicus]|uniref:Uncharacterized protein n=1 Tax=Methyloceanibacter methanicus TaxID=1774968 RepID=A0A1E3VYG0_9HYPH|nr:hypothetical protein [Methyloceanibacter methanicus]ODR98584.1 hypothetical protein AUC68_09265 [Methyloceanibacter methanicus]
MPHDPAVTPEAVLLDAGGPKVTLTLKPPLMTFPVPTDGGTLGLEPTLMIAEVFLGARQKRAGFGGPILGCGKRRL